VEYFSGEGKGTGGGSASFCNHNGRGGSIGRTKNAEGGGRKV
jgi:hypothetical protein